MSNSPRRNGFHGMLSLPAFCNCPGFFRQTTLSGHHISCSLTRSPSPVLSPRPCPQVMTTQALVGTVIAIAGTWLYTETSGKHKHAPKKA